MRIQHGTVLPFPLLAKDTVSDEPLQHVGSGKQTAHSRIKKTEHAFAYNLRNERGDSETAWCSEEGEVLLKGFV